MSTVENGASLTDGRGRPRRHRSSMYWVLAVAIGVFGAVSVRMSDRGFVSGLLVVVAAAFALACIVGVFVSEVTRSNNDRGFFVGALRGIGWSGLSAIIIVLSWIVVARLTPDPALIYLQLRRPYIQAHWRVDPQSGLTYFPIDYGGVDQSGEIVPRNFYVLDKDLKFSIDRYGERLISPSCAQAKYTARLLEEQIYIVRLYVDDRDEPSRPCLVTPESQSGN